MAYLVHLDGLVVLGIVERVGGQYSVRGRKREGVERKRGAVRTHFMHSRSPKTIWYRSSHPHNVGTEYVGCSPTRQISRALSTKRRDVFGESPEE